MELRRTLARALGGPDLASARRRADDDLAAVALVSLDEAGWRAAADVAEELAVRPLDAVHLATASRLQVPDLAFCTFDLRHGLAARRTGSTVVGC